MRSGEIRAKFLSFFKSKGHEIVPSAPLVVKNDPTLMFTNAGMNQFKDYFLGNKAPISSRVADTQKCLRVSGKHNDLEEVGIDTYHHTMFEMLGNWSFGDYFKQEAIEWAWELLTEVYGLPQDRLYATVFEGDQQDGLPADSEAAQLWEQFLPKDRILFASKKDNFWEMGDTGPCGPCSEIHIDLRDDAALQDVAGRDLVNQDHPLVIEIWNLVFIQFNRLANGSLEKLKASHVDTGMGFERLAMAIQQKTSNYDTDVFQPIIGFLADKAGTAYGNNEKTDIALRVIADHIRAIMFTIADGQLPSNNKAGYVIRRILRRAVRYGFTFLGFKSPFLFELVPLLAEQFAEVFPEAKEQQAFIARVIKEEESAFLKTLDKGLGILQQLMQAGDGKTIAGKDAFELYDTYGFPYDLTALIARENGFEVDKAGFDKALEEQKERSRNAAQSETGDWALVHQGQETQFLGYDQLTATTKLLRYRKVKQKKGSVYQLVLEETPFYAESGGQVGDRGYLDFAGERIEIIDTLKENDLILHITKKLPQDPEAVVTAVVNEEKRVLTANNHSATHLMHAALKEVLGDHVQQKGSYVNEVVLRFDFSHFAKMTEEEIEQVEKIVNSRIRENIRLDEKRNIPIEEAKAMGATALFGEKYGEFVRVITFNPSFSVELCGGTHVPATGNIGSFKIVSESSVAAGVRRIEAITAERAESHYRKQETLIREINDMLKAPKDLLKSIGGLLEEKQQLGKQLEKLQQKEMQSVKKELLGKVKEMDGVAFLAEQVELPHADQLRSLAFEMKKQQPNLLAVLAADVNGKPMVAVIIDEALVKSKGLHAGQIAKTLAKEIKGGGGGQPFFATAGGQDLGGLAKVTDKAKVLLHDLLKQAQ